MSVAEDNLEVESPPRNLVEFNPLLKLEVGELRGWQRGSPIVVQDWLYACDKKAILQRRAAIYYCPARMDPRALGYARFFFIEENDGMLLYKCSRDDPNFPSNWIVFRQVSDLCLGFNVKEPEGDKVKVEFTNSFSGNLVCELEYPTNQICTWKKCSNDLHTLLMDQNVVKPWQEAIVLDSDGTLTDSRAHVFRHVRASKEPTKPKSSKAMKVLKRPSSSKAMKVSKNIQAKAKAKGMAKAGLRRGYGTENFGTFM